VLACTSSVPRFANSFKNEHHGVKGAPRETTVLMTTGKYYVMQPDQLQFNIAYDPLVRCWQEIDFVECVSRIYRIGSSELSLSGSDCASTGRAMHVCQY
jgi:hypothetical protein